MHLSCVSNESLGGRRRRQAYWCAPLSMLWFVPDGCVKYWCDHRALRGYPTCHSITAFRPKQQQLWIAKWPFYTLPIRSNSQNCSLRLNLLAVKLEIVSPHPLYSAAMVISWTSCSRSRRDAEISSFCLSAPQLVPPPPQDMKVQLLLLTFTCVFTYCLIYEQ